MIVNKIYRIIHKYLTYTPSIITLKCPMNNEILIKAIDVRIKKARHILLVPHRNPDADSLGAALAFGAYLDSRKIAHSLYCATPIAPMYSFLPGIQKLVNTPPDDVEVICTFDAGDARYVELEKICSLFSTRPFIINIDHHASNEYFGDMNVVIVSAPSTTAVIYRIFQELQININAETATNLLSGLLTDTGTFGNPAASAEALAVGSALLERGARILPIRNALERTKPIGAMKVWGRALSRLRLHPVLGIATTIITQEECTQSNISDDDISGLSNFLNYISDCRATLVLKELPDGHIKGSLRTTRNDTNVANIASLFGGGGHKKAAGFTISGKIVEADGRWQIK